MDYELAQKVRKFVEQGGTFILSAHSAVKNRANAMTDLLKPILLTDLFGVEVTDIQCYQPPSLKKNAIRFEDSNRSPGQRLRRRSEGHPGHAHRHLDRDYMKGSPAVTENKYGKGTAVYYASFFNLERPPPDAALHRRVWTQAGCSPASPRDIEVTRRTKGKPYYFVLNHDDESVAIRPGPGYFDLLENAPAPAAMILKPFEYKLLRK